MGHKSSFDRNILICHACPFRQAFCFGGCVCLRDHRDIIHHAANHDCPLEKFAARGVGDSVAWFLHRIGMTALYERYRRETEAIRVFAADGVDRRDCGCAGRRKTLNTLATYGETKRSAS
jgi:hypothetical protein